MAWVSAGGRHVFSASGYELHELLSSYAPAVILIDEWVAYARSLVARDDLAGGTFDDALQVQRLPAGSEAVTAFAAGLAGPVRATYEAGPTGFVLAWRLEAAGVDCVV